MITVLLVGSGLQNRGVDTFERKLELAKSPALLRSLIMESPVKCFAYAFGESSGPRFESPVKLVYSRFAVYDPIDQFTKDNESLFLNVAKAAVGIKWSKLVSMDTRSSVSQSTAQFLKYYPEGARRLLEGSLLSDDLNVRSNGNELLSHMWSSSYIDLLRPHLMNVQDALFVFAVRTYYTWLKGGVALNRDAELLTYLKMVVEKRQSDPITRARVKVILEKIPTQ